MYDVKNCSHGEHGCSFLVIRFGCPKAAYRFLVGKLHKAKSILFRWGNIEKAKYALECAFRVT